MTNTLFYFGTATATKRKRVKYTLQGADKELEEVMSETAKSETASHCENDDGKSSKEGKEVSML